jgi:hypothetical protein
VGKVLKVTKKNNWLQGVYKSDKSRKLNNFRSSWELKLFQFLDESKAVKNWESECLKIPYILDHKKKYYLPDMLVNGNLLLEVKPANQIMWPMNVAKFEAAIAFCKMKGWKFCIITKEQMSPVYLTEQIILASKKEEKTLQT